MQIHSSSFFPFNLLAFPKQAAQPFTNHGKDITSSVAISDTTSIKAASFDSVIQKSEKSVNSHSMNGIVRATTSNSSKIEMKVVELDKFLTPEDKKLLGWPLPNNLDNPINQIALFISLDRMDGYLEGPITRDYLVGNPNKLIPGLCRRSPSISRSCVLDILKKLDIKS